MTTKAATTITPSTSNQTAVASGVYTTGAITVKGDANLKAGNIRSGVTIFGVTGTAPATDLPSFTYTGTYTTVNDGNNNWRIKFLTSGTFRCNTTIGVDVFLVGGGGGGGKSYSTYHSGGGGGGGYTTTASYTIQKNTNYTIVVGAGGNSATDGSASTAFTYTANGGKKGLAVTGGNSGGNGGSGGGGKSRFGANGKGGSNGGNGANGGGSSEIGYGGVGQGRTTREFGESTGTLYSGGGGAGARLDDFADAAAGGDGGGAAGGTRSSQVGRSAVANTGGGGGGGAGTSNGGSGGSGIVIIRNAR